jgi:hypothetical protein
LRNPTDRSTKVNSGHYDVAEPNGGTLVLVSRLSLSGPRMSIKYQKEDRVGILTIQRPDGTNLLNLKALRELSSALIDFRDDRDLWVG